MHFINYYLLFYRLTEEYEVSQMNNIDWSTMMDNNDNVFCPVCQKSHLQMTNETITCYNCKFNIITTKSLLEIKNEVMNSIEKHTACNGNVEFTIITDTETHIYLYCEFCKEFQLII